MYAHTLQAHKPTDEGVRPGAPKNVSGRQFFVGGNFKMNPVSRAEKHKLVEALSKAEIDTNTGMCCTITRISGSNPHA